MEDYATSVANLEPVPEELLCPITQILMRNPVVLTSGHAVDLDALLTFWKTCPFALTNPMTKEPLGSPEDIALIPALHLRSAIDSYMSRLPPDVTPEGWTQREPGHRSTRAELRAIASRAFRIANASTTVRLGGALPPTATPHAHACLGLYERDATLTNDRPSYTKRGEGTHAIWFSDLKPDGSANGFWHAAEVAHKGSACGFLGAHDPNAVVAEGISSPWQVAAVVEEPPRIVEVGEGQDTTTNDSTPPPSPWVGAPALRCEAAGTDESQLAALLSSSSKAIVISGTLPDECLKDANYAEHYKSVLGVFDRDEALCNNGPSYTKRGGSTALWLGPERTFWHLGLPAHRGTGQGWLHAPVGHNNEARVGERIMGPWQMASSVVGGAEEEGGGDGPPALEGGGGEQQAAAALMRTPRGTREYLNVPLRCDCAVIELTGALPDAMIGQADPHDVKGFLGVYDLFTGLQSFVGGRPVYVQRGTRATRGLWYAESTGFWHCGPMDSIGQAKGPICAKDLEGGGAGGPERLLDASSWQVNDGAQWLRALMLRCRVA